MMKSAKSFVVKSYYKRTCIVERTWRAYSVIPLPILKINQLSEHVDIVSIHFPPSSQFLSPDHVKLILSHSWLLLLLLPETLPFLQMISWLLLLITENLFNSNVTSTEQPLSTTISIKIAAPFSDSIQYMNLGFFWLCLFKLLLSLPKRK